MMFKRGVITDEISQDFKTAAGLASKYRLDGVELRSVWEKQCHELNSKDIREIKKVLADAGLSVCGISSPFFKCHIGDDAEIGRHMEILKRCIQLAYHLETGIIRGFTFWKSGGFEENIGRIAEKFDMPLKILDKERITLALESDPSVFATNADKLAQMIVRINSPYIKALWDPGNDIYDPDGEIPYPDGYRTIKAHMVHMHLKDASRLPTGKIKGMPVGEGQVDYKGQFQALINDGYNGFIVLETHYRPHYEISDELLAFPKGSAFSHLGYEATEECMAGWNGIMSGLLDMRGQWTNS